MSNHTDLTRTLRILRVTLLYETLRMSNIRKQTSGPNLHFPQRTCRKQVKHASERKLKLLFDKQSWHAVKQSKVTFNNMAEARKEPTRKLELQHAWISNATKAGCGSPMGSRRKLPLQGQSKRVEPCRLVRRNARSQQLHAELHILRPWH